MTKKTVFAGLVAAAAAFGAAGSAHAQRTFPLSFEGRIDAGIPVGESANVLDTGVGFGVNAQLHLTPQFAAYGGYSRFEFDGEGLLGDVEVREDGWHAGGKVFFGSGLGVSTPYLQVGALFRDDDTGFEAGGGWDYWVGGSLAVTPQAMYRKIDDAEYVGLGVGARIRF